MVVKNVNEGLADCNRDDFGTDLQFPDHGTQFGIGFALMVQFQEKCDLSVGSLYDHGIIPGLEQDPREVLGDLGIERFDEQ